MKTQTSKPEGPPNRIVIEGEQFIFPNTKEGWQDWAGVLEDRLFWSRLWNVLLTASVLLCLLKFTIEHLPVK